MDSVWQDLRFSLRSLRNDRGFLLSSVVALGLGIGSATAIFSVLDNVLLHPFPYTASDSIYGFQIAARGSAGAQGRNFFSVPEFLDYARRNTVFTSTMAIWETTSLLGSGDRLEPLDTDTVSGNAFQFLGVPPLLGRGILPADARPGAAPVFVLSYKVWLSRFGADPNIVGHNFLLDGVPTTLIGVMPKRFAFWGGDIWTPARLDPAESGADRRFFVLYGRLRTGLSPAAAQQSLSALAARLAVLYPHSYPEHFTLRLDQLSFIASGRFRKPLYTLLAAVALLLLIACANVANLLLARAVVRRREIALRMTLGAGRWRIVRQLMTESLLLSLAGASAGCLLAAAALRGLLAIIPLYTFPDEAAIAINREVLLATAAVAVLTAFVFGLLPALAAARPDCNETLRGSSRGNSGFGAGRLRRALISAEVALSMLLLTGAGLLLRSFLLERDVDLGIRTAHVLTATLDFPPARYRSTGAQARFLRDLLSRLEALPGVVSAAAATGYPPNGGLATGFETPAAAKIERQKGSLLPCTRQYFQTVGLRLLAGRLPSPGDENAPRRVAVINRTMAEKLFGRRDPVGQPLLISALKDAPDPIADPRFQIIGVVSDMKNQGLLAATAPEAFIPISLAGYGRDVVFVRSSGDPAPLTRALTSAVLSLDRNVTPQQIMSLDAALDIGQYARPRFGAGLFAAFAAAGLLLVTIGVYSVVAWSVNQQRREIGIRMALGASPADVRSMVISGALRFTVAGIAAGCALSWAVGRLLASQLWGVSAYDPATLAAAAALIVAIALAAAYAPSLRATRVDPALSLRSE